MNKETKPEIIREKTIKEKLADLNAITESLAIRIDVIEEKISAQKVTPQEFVAPDVPASPYTPKGYVPAKYRQICNEILSPEFGFDVEESADNMDFTVKIIVPEKYAALTAAEKKAGVLDVRSKVISRATGELGVREWCSKVRENLNRFYTSSGVISPFTSK